jgi:hypothetical protein
MDHNEAEQVMKNRAATWADRIRSRMQAFIAGSRNWQLLFNLTGCSACASGHAGSVVHTHKMPP